MCPDAHLDERSSCLLEQGTQVVLAQVVIPEGIGVTIALCAVLGLDLQHLDTQHLEADTDVVANGIWLLLDDQVIKEMGLDKLDASRLKELKA
ncbi:hypothetical protein Syncc9605_1051 [Synechococcus sp. CC9605]|nr:hypothetical protein Syncc9605_1051 [Synechococcus sp. CC9605]